MPYKRKLPMRAGGAPEKLARTSALTPSGLPAADLQRFRSLSRSVTNILTPREQPHEGSQASPASSQTQPPAEERKEDNGDEGNWTEDHHRTFVSAIYDIGMRHSSPSVILASMTVKPEVLTGERLKSHLQKYRKSRVENKAKFMKQYEIGMARLRDGWEVGRRSGASPSSTIASESLPPGEQIALLTDKVLHEKDPNLTSNPPGAVDRWPHGHPVDLLQKASEEGVPVPDLTEQEKKTSVGKSLLLTLGLFREIRQHIHQLRLRSIPPESLSPDPTSSSPTDTISQISTALSSASPQRARSLIEQLASHCTEQYQKSKSDPQLPTTATE